MDQVKFNNWALDLERRFNEFQIGISKYDTPELYWMRRNCVLYDYEIRRLSQFKNPCKACGLPLHLTGNFEIYGLGPVCHLCFDIHTADKYIAPK